MLPHCDTMQLSKRVVRNICQMIFGAIMLTMSYNYVQAHDAEKTNFVSWLTVLKQKITLLTSSFLGQWTTQDFQRQQEMIRNYKELLSYMTTTACPISVTTQDMQEKLDLLTALTPLWYKTQAVNYSTYAWQVYWELQKCTKK